MVYSYPCPYAYFNILNNKDMSLKRAIGKCSDVTVEKVIEGKHARDIQINAYQIHDNNLKTMNTYYYG